MRHLIRGIATTWGAALIMMIATSATAGEDEGTVSPGAWMGVQVTPLNEGWREQWGYRGAGLLVTKVASLSPADRIGVVPGDILVAVGSTSLHVDEDLAVAHSRLPFAQAIPVIIVRNNGTLMKIRNMDPIDETEAGEQAGAPPAGAVHAGDGERPANAEETPAPAPRVAGAEAPTPTGAEVLRGAAAEAPRLAAGQALEAATASQAEKSRAAQAEPAEVGSRSAQL